jgi:hypothetical protein
MAKSKKNNKEEEEIKQWQEATLIETFNLNRITGYYTILMQEWLDVAIPTLDIFEQTLFDRIYKKGVQKIAGWSEEDLKMKFITYILELGLLNEDNDGVIGYFDKMISANVEGTFLKVKSDFMLAKGILNVHKQPYFHFQEYKPQLNPTGEPMAQLLEAFLIGQAKNKTPKPLYGLEIIGEYWKFVILDGKDYCVSKSYSCTEKDDLLQIIAILRNFKHILMTRLIFD